MTNTDACKAGGAASRHESNEGLNRTTGQASEDQHAITNERNSAAQAAASQQKEVATLAAEAALLRCALHPLDGGGFVVTRTGWGLSRRLDTLDQVRRLLHLMAGGQGGAQ